MLGAWQIRILLKRQGRQTLRRKQKKLQAKTTNSSFARTVASKNPLCKMRGRSQRTFPPVVFTLAFWVARSRCCYWDSMSVGDEFFRKSPRTLDFRSEERRGGKGCEIEGCG